MDLTGNEQSSTPQDTPENVLKFTSQLGRRCQGHPAIYISKTPAACHRRTPRESAKGACTFTFPGPGAASEAETEAETNAKSHGLVKFTAEIIAAHCKTTAKKRALSEKWLQLFPPLTLPVRPQVQNVCCNKCRSA